LPSVKKFSRKLKSGEKSEKRSKNNMMLKRSRPRSYWLSSIGSSPYSKEIKNSSNKGS
jgi:hypothetical protein